MSELADEESLILEKVKEALLSRPSFEEVDSPDLADVLLIQEKWSYKDFRYIKKLIRDPIISKNPGRVLTINSDDCATGLLRGLYTSIPQSRFDPQLHVSVPFMEFPNELVFWNSKVKVIPEYLVAWRGNPKSSQLRHKLFNIFQHNPDFFLEKTESWLDHSYHEKKIYVDLILNAKFSLCPTGWAPASFRIYESMALGRCPVILADKFVPPVGPKWEEFALFIPESKVGYLQDFLVKHENEFSLFGKKAFEAWENFFSGEAMVDYYVNSLLGLIENSRVTSKENEFKRWNSFHSYWSNRWTIPQRAVSKIKKVLLR